MINGMEQERYNRQILIDGIGIEGQEKLKKSKILIAGAGGLGSPVSLYLAAAGVGTLRIVDNDRVSLSNLNRQVLYGNKDVGAGKAETAKAKMLELNPHISVESITELITGDNVSDLAEGCDLIIDAMDNFAARYLLNDAAIKKNIPFIYGGVYGLEGALSTIIPFKTPCLRCIFPDAPPPGTAPVLGATTGVIGSLQAMEAVKYIVGTGRLLTDRLLIFDGFNLKFREVTLKRNSRCPCCSC
jgi:adenylyltransferase/sulfurtransferase